MIKQKYFLHLELTSDQNSLVHVLWMLIYMHGQLRLTRLSRDPFMWSAKTIILSGNLQDDFLFFGQLKGKRKTLV